MFTTCPQCALNLALTVAHLRLGQGYVRCGRCSNVFNALLALSEEGDGSLPQAATPASGADSPDPEALSTPQSLLDAANAAQAPAVPVAHEEPAAATEPERSAPADVEELDETAVADYPPVTEPAPLAGGGIDLAGPRKVAQGPCGDRA